jgi:hypothetical protein
MTDATNATADKPRKQIAKREWIDDAGKVLPVGSADVAGVRYTFLGDKEGLCKAVGNSVEYKLGEYPELDARFAAMGAVTKLGNVVNTIVNDDAYDGRDPIPELVEWLTAAQAGQWREPGEGIARGPKYDKDVLATVLHAQLVADYGDKAADVAEYRERLDDKSFYAKVRANTKVMAAYLAEMATRGADAGDNSESLL